MFLKDLINHTKSVLPLFSEKFTDNLSITSLSKTGNDVTVVTSAVNELAVGDVILISGVKTKIFISNITTVNNIATCTCTTDHDLTMGFIKNVEIVSAEAAYNGIFILKSVPDAKTFTFSVPGSPPDSTGYLLTFHNIGFNGVQTVSEIISLTSFKYVNTDTNLIAGDGSNMLVMKAPRISGAATLARANESYTKQDTNKLWGFFVLDPVTVSQDRNSQNDASNERQLYDDYKLRFINDVSFYLFIPTHDSISGRVAIDDAQELARPIFKTLAGYVPKNAFTTNQQTILMPNGHNVEDYNTSYLIYRFQFQVTEFLLRKGDSENQNEFMANTGDTLPNFSTSAFKIFEWESKNKYNETVKHDIFEV